jgi:hypothetical protein
VDSYPIWIRLHPDSLDETLAISVQARIHDPLWLLGRQWQLGELRHDAGATPIDVRVDGTSAPIARMRGGPADATGGPYVTVAPKGAPLETIVEREAVSETGLDGLRLRTDAGLHLLRMLRAAGLTTPPAEWVARCPFVLPAGVLRESLDGETRNWWDLVDGRVPDAAKLKAAVPAALSPPAGTTPVPAAEADVLRAWLKWFGSRFEVAARGASTWDPERFEYSFAVSGLGASGEVVLAAPEYVDGRLDWFDFEQASGSLEVTGQPVQRRSHRIPAPLDFIGMPNPRFWTFEDPSLRFDALELLSRPDTPPSPATLMVLDFALSYGDDWFLVPLAMDAWTVFQATEIAVTDVFGDTAIANHPQGRWNLFRLEAGTTTRSGLSAVYLNASAAEAVEGPPLEELHLLRDEVANVAWAVERLVPHPLNHSVEPPAPSAAGAAGPTGLVWTLAPPSPPRNWFPLLPTEIGRLALGVLWSARDARPAGTLLTELRASKRRLHQEEVPNEGAQVSRRWQSARGSGGSLHFWIGRSKTPRKTDIAPAVRFDLVEWR